jgi:hypothetical protein
MSRIVSALGRSGLAREVGQGIVLLALMGSSVGGLLAMLTLATRAMGRI